MKQLFFALSLVVLTGSAGLAQTQTLLDYRSDGESHKPAPTLSTPTKKAILSQVVRKTDKACSGSLQPKVIDYVSGSFTASGTRQTVYLIDLGDSCHPRGRGTLRLAVFSSNRLLTYGDVTGFHTIKKITDINQDGINEVVLEGGWLGQGILTMSTKLVQMKQEGLVTIKEFDNVYESNPADYSNDSIYRTYQWVSVIKVSRNQQGKVAFQRDNYYSTSCSEEGKTFNLKCSLYLFIYSGEPKEYQHCQHWLLCLAFRYKLEKPEIAYPVEPQNNFTDINKAKEVWSNGFRKLCPPSSVYYSPRDLCFVNANGQLKSWLNKETNSCMNISGLTQTGKQFCQEAATNIYEAVSAYLSSI